MRYLLLAALLLCAVAQAQTSKTEWVAVPVDPAASGATTKTACTDAIKKQYSASLTCVERIKTSAAPPPAVQTWTRLADENQPFTVGTMQTVRFGRSPGPYVQKITSGAGQCTVVFFGSDPAPGQGKFCDLLDGSGTPAPPPVTPPPVTPVTGSATLNWIAPTKSADGTPLTDLAGYRVLYGPASGTYTQSMPASAPPVTVPALTTGAWFFVVKAIDTSGNESASSNEVTKTIP